jgi:hypothetical protein
MPFFRRSDALISLGRSFVVGTGIRGSWTPSTAQNSDLIKS